LPNYTITINSVTQVSSPALSIPEGGQATINWILGCTSLTWSGSAIGISPLGPVSESIWANLTWGWSGTTFWAAFTNANSAINGTSFTYVANVSGTACSSTDREHHDTGGDDPVIENQGTGPYPPGYDKDRD